MRLNKTEQFTYYFYFSCRPIYKMSLAITEIISNAVYFIYFPTYLFKILDMDVHQHDI